MATLAQKIRFLSDPRSFSHAPATVEAIETHMSWVFIAGHRVYKFKKPQHFPFLDFTTLAARQRNCVEEHRLNQTLAGDTYRRILPLTESADGELKLDGDGTIVEWVVEMARVPLALMLDRQMSQGTVRHMDVVAVGEKLANFYWDSAPQITDGHLYIEHLQQEHAVSRELLTEPRFGLASDAIEALDTVQSQLEAVRGEIEMRIAAGIIVEGHGDLRPEHVCLTSPPLIIDRLEFDRSMRILDPYDEVNYLGLECQFLGSGWIRKVLLETLDARLQTPPSPELMAFYGAFRAVLRARICIAHLLDETPATPEIWPGRTRAYLALARAEWSSCSLPGSVETTQRHGGD
ncbi:MAG: hypothetical protein ACOH2N_01195 [Devosia sp.]